MDADPIAFYGIKEINFGQKWTKNVYHKNKKNQFSAHTFFFLFFNIVFGTEIWLRGLKGPHFGVSDCLAIQAPNFI